MHSFADLFWSMIILYFIFMVLWIFIRIFADIFHRKDLSGGMKALWIIAIFIVPFFAAIVYMITRPNTAELPGTTTAQQVGLQEPSAAAPSAAAPAAAAPSSADEIAKLAALRDSGAITPAEFDTLKAKALA